MGRLLAWKNLLNFQKAFARLRAASPSMAEGVVAEQAARATSFGQHRVGIGYGDITVKYGNMGDVTLSDGTVLRNVPRWVEVQAEPTTPGPLPTLRRTRPTRWTPASSDRLSAGGEAGDPGALPWCLDCAVVVGGSGPGDRLRAGQAGQDGETGDDGAGAADPGAAGDFDLLAGACLLVQFADLLDGMLGVAGQPEIRPVKPLMRPDQLVLMLGTQTPGAQVQATVGYHACRCRTPQATTTHPRPVGQFDRTRQLQVAHALSCRTPAQ
jgi:hypothetical protein